ncbi:dCTP deaminase [Sinorhizobium phage ort11]|uniref:Putative dCTP deaminase n=1 Tax=Sinorhizobium phage ort11 TaxID=2599764 RepID=A0A5C2H1E2_9CAUD|nr:dCTP deaminase [Sinorhizobium phage ort11]QEP29844.1 putative dCTP deaminase [Sinorhizobium phage ort11]
MTIINRNTLFLMKPIKEMKSQKIQENGVSYGLAEAGYDIRLKQEISFIPDSDGGSIRINDDGKIYYRNGKFCLASAIEEFDMPKDLVGVVHDKSTWARQGLSVFNTVIEPGWKGFLTLELVHHGNEPLHLPAGCGIAQVIFHQALNLASYEGKYQNQADQPVESIFVES